MRLLLASALMISTLVASSFALAADNTKSCGTVREIVSTIKSKHLLQVVIDNVDTKAREIHTIGTIAQDMAMVTRAIGEPNLYVCFEQLEFGRSTVSNLYYRAPSRQ